MEDLGTVMVDVEMRLRFDPGWVMCQGKSAGEMTVSSSGFLQIHHVFYNPKKRWFEFWKAP